MAFVVRIKNKQYFTVNREKSSNEKLPYVPCTHYHAHNCQDDKRDYNNVDQDCAGVFAVCGHTVPLINERTETHGR